MAIRTSKAEWKGTLKDGSGIMSFSNYNGPFSYASRFESGEGTNPEELVGAAQAGCFSMFLSALISKEKLSPESVQTTAEVHLENDSTGPYISKINLKTEVKCKGLTEKKFRELAETAKKNCPVSRLYASAEITLVSYLL